MELTPYAIFDMDGTLLCSTGMWDHVTDRILAKYGKTITHEQRMANMTLTVEGTAAMFVQQLGVPLSRCWQPCTHAVCACAWHPAPKHR